MSSRSMVIARLDDKTDDTDRVPPGGRWDRYWSHITLSPRRIGVESIEDRREYRDAAEGRAVFNLRSIEFGRWMNESDRQHWLYGAMHGLDTLAAIIDVDRGNIGLGRKLSIALGARGRGGLAMAHYEQGPLHTINLTKTKGKGSLAHEYAHALDNIGTGAISKAAWASGGEAIRLTVDESRLRSKDLFGLYEKFFKVLYYGKLAPERQNLSHFGRAIRSITKNVEYWASRREVWARLFDWWVFNMMERLPARRHTRFLCATHAERGQGYHYPSIDRFDELTPHIVAILSETYRVLAAQIAKVESVETSVLGSQKTVVRTPDGTLDAKYSIVPLASLITSHDPTTWTPDVRYPAGCQQRDYTKDIGEQMKVEKGARNLEPTFMISDVPTSVDGPPVVARKGSDYLVLSGNGRTMMLRLAAVLNSFQQYTNVLKAKSLAYGFAPEDVKRTSVLVRVVDVDVASKCAYYSNLFNASLTQGQDPTTYGFSLARQLTPAALEAIAEIVTQSDAETFAALLADSRASKALLGVLTKSKIVTDRNRSQYVGRDGSLTDAGKTTITSIILGALLKDRELVELARSYVAQIIRVAPLLVTLKGMGQDWDIMPLIVDAMRAESERRASGLSKVQYLKQTSFVRPDVADDVKIVWDALDSGPRRFEAWIRSYIDRAKNEAQGPGMGFYEPLDRSGVLKSLSGRQSLSDAVRAADIAKFRHRPLPLSGPIGDFLGADLPANFSALVWGQKFNGKSSFIMHLADALGAIGPVLLNCAEEPVPSRSVQMRIEATGVTLRNVDLVSINDWSEMMKRVETEAYRFILIDSIPKMTLWNPERDMLRSFVSNRERFGWVFVGRSDKAGEVNAGSSAWGYEVDVEIEVRKHVARQIKNRFLDPRVMSTKSLNLLGRKP